MARRQWLIAQLDAMHRSRGGDWYYRTFAPGRALAELPDVYVVNLDQAHRRLGAVLRDAHVLIVNGLCDADLLPVMQERKQRGLVTVFEINDDVQGIQASNPLAGFFEQPENLRLYRRLALSADAVQYSVPELERLYGSLNRHGRVFENQLVSVPPLRPASDSSEVRLGWGGSSGHLEDMAEVAPVLIDLLQRHPNVVLCLMCSDKIWQLFAELPDSRKRRTKVGSIDEYYRFVSGLDIGIAPNQDRGFNRARSDVKFLEYAGFGAAAAVQRLVPYASVRHEETGFLFGDLSELAAVLTRLIQEPGLRNAVRVRAHGYVAAERTQAAHIQKRLDFYAELLPVTPQTDARNTFEELTRIEGAERHERHLLLAHGRYEALLHDGLLRLQAGDSAGAAMLGQAAALEPTQALPRLLLGSLTESEAELSAALAHNPRSVQAALGLGAALLSRGQLREAFERFLSAAELCPSYEMPYAHAAHALRQMGAERQAAELELLAQNLAAQVTPAT